MIGSSTKLYALLAGAALILTACGTPAAAPASPPTAPPTDIPATSTAQPPSPADQDVNVILTSFGIQLTQTSLPAGRVDFRVLNTAKDLHHEFVLVKTDLAVDKLPVDDKGNVDEEKLSGVGEVDDMAPGQGGELKATLDAGHYAFFCNIPGHYKAGMRGELTVGGSATAGGSGSTANMDGQGAGTPIAVTVSSFRIQPATTTVKAGSFVFHVQNTAKDVKHEFLVLKTDLPADQLPLDDQGNADEDKLKSLGEVDNIDPGGSGDLKVALDPGHYLFICNVPGHYKAGMHTDFTVTP